MSQEQADIEINVNLDDQKLPEDITWRSRQGQDDKWMHCKAMMLSFFERDSKDTFRIDLWTKDMEVMEMDHFMYQSIKSMADTYQRATNNTELANEMQAFVAHFGKATGLTNQ